MVPNRQSASAVATTLVGLYELEFGGKQNGRYRISRKFLHQVAGRKKISDGFLSDIAEEVYEAGFILVDLGAYVAVINQSLTRNYRHVTKNAVAEIMMPWMERENEKPPPAKRAGTTKRKVVRKTKLGAKGV